MLFRPKVVVGFVLLALFTVQFVVPTVLAASTWSQSDWVGGPGQSAWSNATMFSNASDIDYSVAGQVTLTSSPPSDWYSPDWQYRNELTVDPDQIPGSDPLTDFPLLVSLGVNSDLPGGAQDDAADVVFTADDGVTELNYEIESFASETGALVAWVSIPELSPTDPTTLYMYYGNPDGTLTPGNNVQDVWTNYGLVMHMNQASGQFLDSTGNANDTTTAVVEAYDADGQVNGAIEVNDSIGQLSIPNNANGSLDVTTDFTISFWVQPESGGGAFQQVIQKAVDGNDPNNYGIYVNFDSLYFSFYNGGFRQFQSSNDIDYDEWNYVTYRRTGSIAQANLTQYFYVDGALSNSGSVTTSDNELLPNTAPLLMVRQPSGFPLRGVLDEVRISHSPFTPEYITAEYNNQDDPASFVLWGPQEEYQPVYETSGNLTSSIFDSTHPSLWGQFDMDVTLPPSTQVDVKARTGNDPNLADAPDFSTCTPLVNGGNLTDNACVEDGDQYIQYQAFLSTSDTSTTPVLNEVSFTYDPVPPTPTPTPSPTPQPTSNPGSSSPASSSAPVCEAGVPVGIPDLFQINRSGASAQLFFTPVQNTTEAYHVVFGFQPGDERFGGLSQPVTTDSNTGVQSMMIYDLDPKATYWFSVAPVNGCAVGSWSPWLQTGPVEGSQSIFYRYTPAFLRGIL